MPNVFQEYITNVKQDKWCQRINSLIRNKGPYIN